MKRLFLLIGLLLGASAPAHAQSSQVGCGVNFTPQVGINCANVRVATYTAAIFGLVPHSSATDFFCIAGASGGSTKSIHIRRWRLTGTAGTLVTTPIRVERNSIPDTGTPSADVTTVHAFNSANPTATAVVAAYDSTGGNPTIGGTAILFDAREITLGVSGTTAAPADEMQLLYGTQVDSYEQGLDIPKGSTVQYCLNLNAVSVSSGVLWGQVEWTEE